MKSFILNDVEVNLPEDWADIKFNKFLEFTKLIGAFDKRDELDSSNEVAVWERTLDDLQDSTKVLSFWCGMSENEISMIDLDLATEIMNQLSFINEAYEPIALKDFTFEGEKYNLPQDLMADSSFGRYVEAEQLELQSNLIDEGKIEILTRQVAILCKKEGEGEKLDDEVINKRAEAFKNLDMATIWDVAFFFSKLEQKLMLNFLISQAVQEIPKQELQQKEQ
jgi:hypothetical protein|tara:strand:+ start:3750 stop:4418 length:669 start_codon:yes stop_codon:yes gene_type:complete